jgi:hypothetical protein
MLGNVIPYSVAQYSALTLTPQALLRFSQITVFHRASAAAIGNLAEASYRVVHQSDRARSTKVTADFPPK